MGSPQPIYDFKGQTLVQLTPALSLFYDLLNSCDFFFPGQVVVHDSNGRRQNVLHRPVRASTLSERQRRGPTRNPETSGRTDPSRQPDNFANEPATNHLSRIGARFQAAGADGGFRS